MLRIAIVGLIVFFGHAANLAPLSSSANAEAATFAATTVAATLVERIETSSLSAWVGESDYGYPIVISLHAIGLAIAIGILLMVDLRLLNVVRGFSLPTLVPLIRLAWLGFAINALSGISLFAAQASTLLSSPPFLTKIGMILLGAVATAVMQRQLAGVIDDRSTASAPASIKLLAAASVIFWLSAICAGRLIAYF